MLLKIPTIQLNKTKILHAIKDNTIFSLPNTNLTMSATLPFQKTLVYIKFPNNLSKINIFSPPSNNTVPLDIPSISKIKLKAKFRMHPSKKE
jgi:hypothetical protein